jgi:hypothetical protein
MKTATQTSHPVSASLRDMIAAEAGRQGVQWRAADGTVAAERMTADMHRCLELAIVQVGRRNRLAVRVAVTALRLMQQQGYAWQALDWAEVERIATRVPVAIAEPELEWLPGNSGACHNAEML